MVQSTDKKKGCKKGDDPAFIWDRLPLWVVGEIVRERAKLETDLRLGKISLGGAGEVLAG